MTNYRFMVVSDTNNIIEYIYASSKYKFIRGASLLLDYLNTMETETLMQINNGKKLSVGGGEARALFTTLTDAQKYEYALKALYLEKTDEVTLTTAIVARNENETILEWIARAEEALRYVEIVEGKKQLHQITLAPIMQRCEACHNRVAEELDAKYSGVCKVSQFEHLCLSCAKKLHYYEYVKTEIEKTDSKIELKGVLEVYKKLQADGQNQGKWISAIEDLVEGPGKDKKIGFLYADGKGIGKLFKQNSAKELTAEDYTNKSTSLHHCMINAATRTHKELVKQGFNEVLVDYALIGGDDLAAILPGKMALQYAHLLAKHFEEETICMLGERFSLAVGVVIAKNTFPIHQLFNLSYELMARTKSNHQGGAVDFEYILDSNAQSIEHIRSDAEVENTNRRLYLEGFAIDGTSGYTLDAMIQLAKELKAKKFPQTKIKGIYHMTTEPNEVTLNFLWKEWLSRLDKKHRQQLVTFDKKLNDTPFALERENKLYTPMRELFEIYDLVDEEA